jgi:hypothetical protein
MLLELAKPLSLLASMLSLLVVFHTAFLGSETEFDQRIYDSLIVLALSAGVSLVSGLLFRETLHPTQTRAMRILETFPMLVFFWTTGVMLVVFVVAWYLETHCILYRDVRF